MAGYIPCGGFIIPRPGRIPCGGDGITYNISKSELQTKCKREVAAVFGSIMRHLDSMREQGKPMYIVLIPERIMEHPMLWKEETLQIKEKILRVSGDADPIFVKIPNILELGAIGFERLNNDDKYAIKYAIKTTKKMNARAKSKTSG